MKIIVLDIGGTTIKSALYSDGTLSDIRETPSNASLGGLHLMNTAISVIRGYQQTASFDRIGISTAGQVDPVQGNIIYANQNIPGYTGMPIRELLEEHFGVPVSVENDVNAAALGEAFFGAGRNTSDFVCLTYGTGIGGALFINGHLYRGSSFSAGEFGALITHPEDRNPTLDFYSGCYEKYASSAALVRRASKYDPSLTDGRRIFERINEVSVCHLVDQWITEIVYGLISIIHMLNPAYIILGGGIMEQEYIIQEISRKLAEHIMPSFRHVTVKRAELGNQAGMFGAAVLHLL